MVFNLELSRFWRRVERRVLHGDSVPQAPRRRTEPRRLRVGCLGAFSELYSASAHLFAGVPDEVELWLFDSPYKKRPFAPAEFGRDDVPRKVTFFELPDASFIVQRVETLLRSRKRSPAERRSSALNQLEQYTLIQYFRHIDSRSRGDADP